MSDLEARVMTLHHNGGVWVTSEDYLELEAKLAEWQAQQHYTYIGRDGKAVLARDLEDRAEAAETKLEKARVSIALIERHLTNLQPKIPQMAEGGWGWDKVIDAYVDPSLSAARTTLAELTGGQG